MTQFQFDLICKIIQNGAPALAQELCEALSNFVMDNAKLVEEYRILKEAFEASKSETASEKAGK